MITSCTLRHIMSCSVRMCLLHRVFLCWLSFINPSLFTPSLIPSVSQILPTVNSFFLSGLCLWTVTRTSDHIYWANWFLFFVFFLIFLFLVPCGRLSWLSLSFQHTLEIPISYHIVHEYWILRLCIFSANFVNTCITFMHVFSECEQYALLCQFVCLTE